MALQVIPLSSLANIGLAELHQRQSSVEARGRLSSWLPLPLWRRRGNGVEVADSKKAAKANKIDGVDKHGHREASLAEVPVLALSYWTDGEPR